MASRIDELLDVLRVPPGKQINLKKDYDPGFTGKWVKKQDADEVLAEGVQQLAEMQDKLYAQDNYAVLMILQALDAAGGGGTFDKPESTRRRNSATRVNQTITP